jgi:hypothetical protein
MNKRLIFIAITAIFASIILTSCRSSKQATAISVTDRKEMPKQANMPAEVEITFPCSGTDSDEEFFRVNGTGKSKDRMMAKDYANQNALANLASKLAGVMSMGNQKVGVSTNADGEEFHEKMITVSKLIAQANVSGYRTACEKYTVNTQDSSYNSYVSIEFGKKKIVKQLYESLSNEKLLKADYDFDRYMKAFEEDLEEYEKANK